MRAIYFFSLLLFTFQIEIFDVIIIGGGVSGITCAHKLHPKLKVLVLEGSERLFGRVWSNREFGFALDMGASWIHGIKDNPLTKLAQDQRIPFRRSQHENSITIHTNNGSIVPNSLVIFEYARYIASKFNVHTIASRLTNDIPLAELFEKERNSYRLNPIQNRIWFQNIRQSIELNHAYDYEKLSAKYYDSEEEFDGDHVVFPNGYDEIFKGMLNGLNIKLNISVNSIKLNPENKIIHIKTSNGEFFAKKVVVTVSLGVLKNQIIKFEPELPVNKLKAIDRLEMGLLNKLVLIFDKSPWINSYDFYFPLQNGTSQDFRFVMNWKRFSNHNALILLISGSFAKKMEEKDDRDVMIEAMKHLKLIIPNLPDPIKYKYTRWSKHPLYYGSYSTIPVGSHPKDLDEIGKQVEDYLYFAGEATHSKYMSTVHAAYFSGIREANKILQSLK